MSGSRLPSVLGLAVLTLLGGCAVMPALDPLPPAVAHRASASFSGFLRDQWRCPGAIDADVSIRFSSLVSSGGVSGSLLAMRPGRLLFEALNPFGLTEGVLATDGHAFTYVAIRGREAYTGKVDAAGAKRYLPSRLAAPWSYYWLIGRLPPGKVDWRPLGRDRDDGGVWFEAVGADGLRHRILFSPRRALITRHQALDADGTTREVDISYEYGDDGDGGCPLPRRLRINAANGAEIVLTMKAYYPAEGVTEDRFLLDVPAGFNTIGVQ